VPGRVRVAGPVLAVASTSRARLPSTVPSAGHCQAPQAAVAATAMPRSTPSTPGEASAGV
jgi:hypothetical protein